MTDDTFMQAILADPDDDTHRLVYADWLDEYGNEEARSRAALIRAQCRAICLPPGKERRALEKQARAIIKANPSWTKPITQAKLGKSILFKRGFIHRVTLPAIRFAKVASTLFELAPTVRSVIFPQPLNEIDDLIGCPYIARLNEADVSQYCGCGACEIDVEILEVFTAPLFSNLTYLRASGNRLNTAGARVLAASTCLPNLRELDLSDNELGNTGARALLKSHWMGQLKRLVLTDNDIDEKTAAALRKCFGDVIVL